MKAEPVEAWKLLFSEVLKKAVQVKKEKNSRLSLRYYAKKLKISPGALSEIIKNKRSVKPQKALEILEIFEAPARDLIRIKNKMGISVEIKREKIQESQMDFLTDWISHAVMGFFEIDNPDINAKWISQKINQPLPEIKKRIDQFMTRGLLQKSKEGLIKIARRGQHWHVSKSIDADLRFRFHEQQVVLAAHALRCGSPDRTFFSSMTFLGTQSQLDLFQTEIKELYDRIVATVDLDSRKELLRISVQAFPFEFKK